MKKIIVIALLLVAAIAIYFVNKENAPADQSEPNATTQPTQNNSHAAPVQSTETSLRIPSAQTQNNDDNANTAPAQPVEQTQNAVDFNAAGAGTAEQKAGAAAAATKAYEESKKH